MIQRLNPQALRKISRTIFCFVISLAPTVALSAVITVAAATPPGIRSDGKCSLVEAIVNANRDRRTYADCAAGRGADVIVLPISSTQQLSAVNNTSYGATGLPVISSDITIEGNGSTIVRSSSATAFRIFAVAKAGALRLRNIEIRGGSSVSSTLGHGGGLLNYGTLELQSSSISYNTSPRSGGGVASFGGTLIARGSLFTGNSATVGGAISIGQQNMGLLSDNDCADNASTSDGGCLYVSGGSVVTVSASTIRDNDAGGAGGGLRVEFNGVLTVVDSAVSGNWASLAGGGASSGSHATLVVQSSTLDNNVSQARGGGLYFAGTVGLINNSTISGNAAPRGGGIGAGSYTTPGSVEIKSSTIVLNQATELGGGVFNTPSGSLALTHTLVSGNTAKTSQSEVHDVSGTVLANAFNLLGMAGSSGTIGFTPGPTDIVPSTGLEGILNPQLTNNGGTTLTHALMPGSEAINAGDQAYSKDLNSRTVMYDQRGVGFRRFDTSSLIVDIGAFEAQP